MRTLSRTLLLLGMAALTACDNGPAGPEAPAEIQVASGQDQQGTVGQALAQPLVAKVVDDDGDPVSGQLVNFVVTRGGGTLSAASALTNAQGIAQSGWTLGTVADSQRVEARAADASGAQLPVATFRALAGAGAAAGVTAVQAQVNGQPGAALDSVAALVKDQFGNPVAGATVTWTVASGGGAVSPATSTTNTQGVARARWTLGANVGTQTLQGAAGGSAATFTATSALGAGATLAIVSGNNQTGAVTTELPAPLVVEVRQNGAPVQGVQVQWSTADGTLATGGSVTDAQGRASARWTLGAVAGTRVAQALVPGVGMAVAFNATATAGAPASLSVSTPDLLTREAGEVVNVRFTVRDVHGNPVPGATVNVSATHGSANPASATTDAEGFLWVAWTLPTHLGPTSTVQARLTSSVPGTTETVESRATVRPAAPVMLTITPDVHTAQADERVTFGARLEDAYGNRFSPHDYTGCRIIWTAPAPAYAYPVMAGPLYPALEIMSARSVTITATCGTLSDTAELVIQ